MTDFPEETGVLIVGAGPTGLCLAIMLRRVGVECMVVDRLEAPLPWSRALGLHARTLEIFDALGVLERIRERSLSLEAVQVYNDKGPVFRLDLTTLDAPFPWVLSCPQAGVEASLEERLRELGGRVHRGVELMDFTQDGDGVRARLNDTQARYDLRCRILVGCDGARSLVREQLGLRFDGVRYRDHFLLADVDIDWDLDRHSSHGFLLPDGALIALPMPSCWRLVINQREEEIDGADPPTLDPFRKRLASALGTVPEIGRTHWISRFSIHRRLAGRYRRNHVLLAGDACHVQSPMGAQGLNTGIGDAFNLGWKLGLYMRGVGGGRLLDSYEQERRPVARGMLNAVDFLSRSSFARNAVFRAARDSLLRMAAKRDVVGRRLLRRASQLDTNYRASPMVETGPQMAMRRGVQGPKPGDRMPDVPLVYPDGVMSQRLQALLRDPRHHLIVWMPPSGGHRGIVTVYGVADRMYSDFREFVDVTVISPAPVEPALADLRDYDTDILVDGRGQFARRFGQDPGFWLVRPDGHLAWRGSLEDADHLLDWVERFFRRA